MKSRISQIKTFMLQSMLSVLALVCMYTPTVSCMNTQEKEKLANTSNQSYFHSITEPPKSPQQIKLSQRQYQLMIAHNKQDPYVSLDGGLWRRIEERRRNGLVIVLTPDSDSPYNGHFVRTIKEITHIDGNYSVRNFYEPSQAVAFVTGSIIVGTALYWYFQKGSSTSE